MQLAAHCRLSLLYRKRVPRKIASMIPARRSGSSVNGHWEIRLGGLVFSGLAATSFPGWWPRVLPGGAELGCQGDHSFSGEGFGEPVGVALCQDEVGVVEQPVHGGGGQGLGHDGVES